MATTYFATEKQLAFLNKLREERGFELIHPDDWAGTSKNRASQLIDYMLAQPKRVNLHPSADVESGVYRSERTQKIFKVYKGQSGRMLAKELTEDGFDYAGLASRFVIASERMTLEQAKEYGAIYGVCVCCGATLTDERSISMGIGPVCAGKYF
jgi:hypothetical protein